MLTLTLLGLFLLLILGLAAPFLRSERLALRLVLGGVGGLALALGTVAVIRLVAGGEVTELSLPLGLPWIGSHFRLDVLSCFFLAAINLATAMIMLFATGYTRRQVRPIRTLAALPVFLAACNLVLVADDAFTFVLAWEPMAVAAWRSNSQPMTRSPTLIRKRTDPSPTL